MNDIILKDLIEEHLKDCQARLSPHTVKNHRVCLNEFAKFLVDTAITDLTKNDVRVYLNTTKQRGVARSTLAVKFSILCSFLKYIETYHNIKTPCLDDVDINSYAKSTWEGVQGHESLSRSEIRALMEAPDNLRDTLIIAIFYYSGMRVSELATLRVKDVDTVNRIFQVIGKGNKPRKIPYSTKLDRAIYLWLTKERRSYVANNESYFFPSMHQDHLSPKAISNKIHYYAVKAGIQRVIGTRADGKKIYKVHAHVLRHSYATHAAEDDIPLPLIQRMMGHKNIGTTIKYMGDTKGFKGYYDHFKGV